MFADIAREKGVPDEYLLVENKSTNTGASLYAHNGDADLLTGENVRFTKQLLEERGLTGNRFLLVSSGLFLQSG